MPYDITLCGGGACPQKNFCYRYTAEVLGRQTFFGAIPYENTTKSCDFFIKNDVYFKEVRERAYSLWKRGLQRSGKSVEHWREAERGFWSEIV